MSLLAFDTKEEAIALANNREFGLASGLFTSNVARAHRVSERLRTGICWVNISRAFSSIAPFGGCNHSGHGHEGGMEVVLDYTPHQDHLDQHVLRADVQSVHDAAETAGRVLNNLLGIRT